jgi:hypothetical protein
MVLVLLDLLVSLLLGVLCSHLAQVVAHVVRVLGQINRLQRQPSQPLPPVNALQTYVAYYAKLFQLCYASCYPGQGLSCCAAAARCCCCKPDLLQDVVLAL